MIKPEMQSLCMREGKGGRGQTECGVHYGGIRVNTDCEWDKCVDNDVDPRNEYFLRS